MLRVRRRLLKMLAVIQMQYVLVAAGTASATAVLIHQTSEAIVVKFEAITHKLQKLR